MDKRPLGTTGEELSIVGFGGILAMEETPQTARALVARAIDRGVNYFDVAPTYGNAEERLGPALEPYRSSVFLACKTEKRTADEATSALHQSLERMHTDHFDLYQLHAVTTLAEVEQIFAPGGAMEALLRAREEGFVRLLGFSAHSEAAALALMEGFHFDTILFPLNWVCWYQGGFGPQVVERAQQKELGILALKSLARRRLNDDDDRTWAKCWYDPMNTAEEVALALRFTLSRPVTAAVSPGHAELLWWACDAADAFVPLSSSEEAELARRSSTFRPLFPQDSN